MCGIAGVYRFRDKPLPVNRVLDALLLGIESRGKDATGFAHCGFDGGIAVDKQAISAKKYIKGRPRFKDEDARIVLGHTRAATQGKPEVAANNHPVVIGTSIVTHNGVIYNDDELFKEHKIVRCAQVDTEIIPALLHKMGFAERTKALEELKGWFAIAAVDILKPDTLILAKGASSPLCYVRKGNYLIWASTRYAIREMWQKVLGTPPEYKHIQELEEGQMLTVTPDGVELSTFQVSATKTYSSGSYTPWWEDEDDEPAGTSSVAVRRLVTAGSSASPTVEDFKKVESFEEWAKVEIEVARRTINMMVEITDLEFSTIQWLLFICDSATLNRTPELMTLHKWLAAMYERHYDRLLGELLEEEIARDEEEETMDKELGDKLAAALDEREEKVVENLTHGEVSCSRCALFTIEYPCYHCSYDPALPVMT